ncbi:MAG: hypothetical protein JWP29_353 [Rhodoferax sp.]|nr:hypothetical protein [Rhodoferax sp.]
MNEAEFKTPTYPVVSFLVARGALASVVLSVLVALACIGAGLSSGWLWLVPLGIVVAAVLLVVLLSYVEVLRIIADTLIPKY